MKIRGIILASSVAVAISGAAFAGSSYEVHRGVYHYAQQQNNWCGPTVVEMWTDSMRGQHGSSWSSQREIAARYGIENAGNGTSGDKMEYMLEHESGRSFQQSAKTKKGYLKKMVKEIGKYGRPVATAVKAVYTDGRPSVNGGHWWLIDGYKAKKRKGRKRWQDAAKSKYLKGFKVNDPAYYSPVLPYIASVPERKVLSESSFFRKYASKTKWRGTRYLVIDD